MSEKSDVSSYPIFLLVDILDRVVDDSVMDALAHRRYDDITRGHGIVFEMIDSEGSRVADMARRAGMTKQAMGQHVTAVESLGYVERGPDPTDGRAQLVHVTPAGARAAKVGRAALHSLEEQWRDRLGHRRYEAARRALVELVETTGMDHVR